MSDGSLERRKRWTLAVLVTVATALTFLPLAVATGWIGGGEETVRVAFLPFAAPGSDAEIQRAASAVGQSLHTRFEQDHPDRLTLMSPTLAAQYRGRGLLPVEMGRKLRADVVVGGQVKRDTATAGARAVVSAQVVRVADGRLLWTGRWQLDDPASSADRRRVVSWLENRIGRTLQTVKP